MSDTPRTDAVYRVFHEGSGINLEHVAAAFDLARALEREINNIKSLRIHPDRLLLLDIERGGHRIQLDLKDYCFRVLVNGAVHATFSALAMTEIPALTRAAEFLGCVESDALRFPKPPDTAKP